jgi:hypothetical protein
MVFPIVLSIIGEKLPPIIEEKLSIVVDPGQPLAMQEVALGKHLSPHLVHDGNLREETMAADVKMVAFVLHRSGNAAEDRIFLEDHRLRADLRQLISRRKPRRAPSDDHDLLVSWVNFRHWRIS